MTIPISFFKKSDELERINKQHSGSFGSKVVIVVAEQENQKQYEWLLNLKAIINRGA